MHVGKSEVSMLLNRLSSGDRSAEERLLECVYYELHRIAERCMRSERRGHTLQPTALVNEAYARLTQQDQLTFENRVHFYAIAARLMRRILTDHARKRQSLKRGAGQIVIELIGDATSSSPDLDQMLVIDALLEQFSKISPRGVKVVEMRFFVGMSDDETAEALQVSRRTVIREWLAAKAWLYGQLNK